MAEARAALRSLLRTVNSHITSVTGNRLWHDEVTVMAPALAIPLLRHHGAVFVVFLHTASDQQDSPLTVATSDACCASAIM
jgi:hypothetical protein